MTRSLQLHTSMCEFRLLDGSIHSEKDYADLDGNNGWRNFPYKRKVVEVRMFGRYINADTMRIAANQFRGFAIHFVGAATIGKTEPYLAREIMLVQKNMKVFVCSYNLKKKKWYDYTDDLKNPERPHLQQYDLSVHGM